MIAISRRAKVAVGGAGLLMIACWLSCGVFRHREFGDLCVFFKHRLSTRFYFHAPLGESNTLISSLTPAQQLAEMAYEEFVERNGGYRRVIIGIP